MPKLLNRAVKLSLASLALHLCSVSAAPLDDPASQLLRDQQQHLRQLEQSQRLQRWQRQQPEQHQRDDSPPIDSNMPCVPVSGMRVQGNQQLSARQLEQALRPLQQPCLSAAAINRVLRVITARYVAAGYPLARPYLRQIPQPGEALEILIVEGFVESVELAGDLPLSLRGAFPDLLGQPLHLPQLEQGLDQLNRLRAYTLSADLLPGEAPGASRVAIIAQQSGPRWHLDSRFDTRGSQQTGRNRLNLSLGVDSPLGLNDDLRLSRFSTVFAAPGNSQGTSLYYSLPYGPWTFALNASQLGYRSPLAGQQQATGSSRFQGLSGERVLWRNGQGMLSAGLRLDHKQLENYQQGKRIALQSPTLTTLDVGLNLLWLEHGLWTASLGASQGLKALGADRQAPGRLAPRPDFRKYRASLLYLSQPPPHNPWRWQSELNLQTTRDFLPAVEQLQLSDDSSVRGLRQHSVAGSSGAVWRNTLSYPFALFAPTVQLRPFLGVDLGWSRYQRSSPPQRLAGSALGLELSLPGNRIRLDYQRALYASERPRGGLEPGFWSLEWTLNL